MSCLPPEQNIPSYVLSRRRHAISGGPESAYRSRPRMKRRGAISFEKNDSAAEYIRYLGMSNFNSEFANIIRVPRGGTNYLEFLNSRHNLMAN